MLTHPTIDQLHELKLTGMATALCEQLQMTGLDELSFEERLGLLVDREQTERDTRRLKSRLAQAKLRQSASIHDIDFKTPRGLDKKLVLTLTSCEWIREHRNILVCGPCGVGKSFLVCALAHKACQEGHTVRYARTTRLLDELALARADGTLPRLMTRIGKMHVLVLDDFALTPLTDQQRRDLLEIIEDRHHTRSTIITSQLPVDAWHKAIDDPTLADAILDRVVHTAHHINLRGDSMRKTRAANNP